MHELAIAENLLSIISEEMEKRDLHVLRRVHVVAGQLTAIVPEALETAFTALIAGTAQAEAHISVSSTPIQVQCRTCGQTFTPDAENRILMPCPACNTELGHTIIAGKELYIEHIEAD